MQWLVSTTNSQGGGEEQKGKDEERKKAMEGERDGAKEKGD